MLELLGLFLAIIDFAGLTDRLEKSLDLFRQRVWAFQEAVNKHGETAERLHNWFNGICFVVLMAYLLYKSASESEFSGIPWLHRWTLLILSAALAAFLGTAICSIVLLSFAIALYAFILTPFVFTLRLLDKPPRGTVGSVGLLLAVIGVIHRFAPR